MREERLGERARHEALLLTPDAMLKDRAEMAEAERDRLVTALRRIQQWDCLNPPCAGVCADLPWLKRLVDDALAESP